MRSKDTAMRVLYRVIAVTKTSRNALSSFASFFLVLLERMSTMYTIECIADVVIAEGDAENRKGKRRRRQNDKK